MRISEFVVERPGYGLTCALAEPDEGKLAPDAGLVLTFAMDRRSALLEEHYDDAAKLAVAAGHRALSFDLPEHGERVTPSRSFGITGMCEALLAGDDPFRRFVEDGRAVINTCLARGLAREGRILVSGVSRAGYCALRLAADDPRIGGVAGLAPVTDWRALSEFAAVTDRADVAALALEHFVPTLAGRPVYLAIGNQDDRVSTFCCLRFAWRLLEEENRRGITDSHLCLHIANDSEGHAIHIRWCQAGARFLVELL